MATRRERRITAGIALGLALLSAASYAPAWRNGFVSLDDEAYLTANPHVARGLDRASVLWAFTTTHESNWHPLTWLSHLLDVSLWGMEPGPHHAMSVAIHAASSALLFLAFFLLSAEIVPSAVVAALFAVHPLRVESVAWASERKDVLAGLFLALTLLAWARYVRRPATGRWVVAATLFALGLLAKATVVTLPLVLLLLDAWPLGRLRGANARQGIPQASAARLVLEKIPLLALSAAAACVAVGVQGGGGSLPGLDEIPVGSRVASALVGAVAYLGKALAPTGLAVFVPHPALLGRSVGLAQAAGAAALVASITMGVALVARRLPYLAVGWLWYVVMLLPMSGLVQVGLQARADRYAYLPLVGIQIAVAWAGWDAARRWPRTRPVLLGAAAVAIVMLAVVTFRQTSVWKDSTTLYEHAIASVPDNWLAEANLGVVLERQGRLSDAAAHLERAVAIRPADAFAHFNLGIVRERQGDAAAAVKELETAAGLRPDWDDPRLELAAAHIRDGLARWGSGDLAGAESAFRAAMAVEPRDAHAMANLAAVLDAAGRADEATALLERAVSIRPELFAAWMGLGALRERRGDLVGAQGAYRRAAVLRPSDAGAAQAVRRVGAGSGSRR